MIILTNIIIVPLYPKYLKNKADPKPEDAKMKMKNPFTISMKESFKYPSSFLIHDINEFIKGFSCYLINF